MALAPLRRVNGELVMRAYTPASSDDDLGYFDLVGGGSPCISNSMSHGMGISRT